MLACPWDLLPKNSDEGLRFGCRTTLTYTPWLNGCSWFFRTQWAFENEVENYNLLDSQACHTRELYSDCHSCDEHMTNEHMTFLKRARERTGRSRRCFGGWKISPPIQRCWLRQIKASMLKKTSKIEYMFSSCISILSKKEYTTFFPKFYYNLRRRRIWVRATWRIQKKSKKSCILIFAQNLNTRRKHIFNFRCFFNFEVVFRRS
jgi:hypothetical protein